MALQSCDFFLNTVTVRSCVSLIKLPKSAYLITAAFTLAIILKVGFDRWQVVQNFKYKDQQELFLQLNPWSSNFEANEDSKRVIGDTTKVTYYGWQFSIPEVTNLKTTEQNDFSLTEFFFKIAAGK